MNVSILDQQAHNLREARGLLQSQALSRDSVDRLLCSYCLTSQSAIIKRTGLEFMYMNEYYHELQKLIHINAVRPEFENQQWAHVYQVLLNHKNNTEHPKELLNELETIEKSSPSITIIVELAKMTIYQSMHEYRYIGEYIVRQQQLIDDIHDPMLRHSFQLRLREQLFMYYWKRNEGIIARKYAYKMLTHELKPLTCIRMHVNLGLTYLFDTFEQGMFHFNKAICIAKEHQETKALYSINNKTIPFFAAYFKRTEGIRSELLDEQAFVLISQGKKKEALTLLQKTSINDPYLLYYMGLATGEDHYFIRSYDCFIERRGDLFFVRLPVEALRNT